METPGMLSGHYYPSGRVCRCARFHQCVVTKKCQNYDAHNLQCNVCESRTNAHEIDPNSVPLGGHIPEGEYYPDLQDAITTLEDMLNTPFAHPDTESQTINSRNIARKYEREHKVTEMLSEFSSLGKLQIEEKLTEMYCDPDKRKIIGRID